MTIKKSEPICIEESVCPGKRINHFKQAVVVIVIGLVEVLILMEKPWFSENPIRIMMNVLMKDQCMNLRCVLDKTQTED